MRHLRLALFVAIALASNGRAARAEDDTGVALESPDAGTLAHTEPPPAAPTTAPGEAENPELPSTFPAEHRPTIAVSLDPTSGLAVGDVLHVDITVRVPDGDDVNLPRMESLAPFEVLDQSHTERVESGQRVFAFRLDVMSLEPGAHELPAMPVRVITPSGEVGNFSTPAQPVEVVSLLANEPDAQPREATPPMVVMEDDYTLAYVGGALGLMLLAALVTWLVMRWWSRRPKAEPPPPPPRPAWEVCMEKLRAARRDLPAALAAGSAVRVVDAASDAVREYLGRRFDFNGLESTTDEVVAHLTVQRLVGITPPEIGAFLGDADLVKFAKYEPTEADCERLLTQGEGIVHKTMHGPAAIALPPTAPIAHPPPQPFHAVTKAPTTAVIPATPTPPPVASPTPSTAVFPQTNPPPSGATPSPEAPADLVADAHASPAVLPGADSPAAAPAASAHKAIPETVQPPPAAPDDDALWAALEDAVAADQAILGVLEAHREDGFLVRVAESLFALLPEAHAEGTTDEAIGSVGRYRVASVNTARRRLVVSLRDVPTGPARDLRGGA